MVAQSGTDIPNQGRLFEWLLKIGDTTLILSQGLSRWCGHGPTLEEDIAIANTSLDLLGQTRLWLEFAAEIEGKGRTADDLAFHRDVHEFRNILLVEYPNTDLAISLMRQFLFDAYHLTLLRSLTDSTEQRVAQIADKALKEVCYHFERSAGLVIRLGTGTDDSQRRMDKALETLWHQTGDLFVSDDVDLSVAAAQIAPAPEILKVDWEKLVSSALGKARLEMPLTNFGRSRARRGSHGEHLGYLIAEMQFLQRAYPDATW
jgi:ring-1,2-phenylacetyl-CoA epoxidase subunit PaaC